MRAGRLEVLEWVTITLVAGTLLQWAGCGAGTLENRCPPYPSILSVAPQPLRAVNADTVILVKGSNFDVTSYATFNGKLRATMVDSDQVLHILLNAADMSRPQSGALVVVTPDPFPFGFSNETDRAPCGDHVSAPFTVTIWP